MLKNKDIICISSIDWDFVWQGHQEIMATFAKNGNRVLFIENTGIRTPNFKDVPRLKKRIINWGRSVKGFRKESENLFVYSPVIFPFPYSRFASWLNKYILIRPLLRWMKVTGFRNPIIWTFLPTGTALDIINNIEKSLLIYYCIADFYELGDPKKIEKTENELIKNSDLIFVQGEVLAKKCRQLNKQVYIFPFGVKIENFDNFYSLTANAPSDIRDIKKPIIGYIGGIHKHIDFGLIKFIAKSHPEWSIVLIGPLQTSIHEIEDLKNVFFLGQKEFVQLPYYINEFNVCIIPYLKTEYTATVYPTKLNEYHVLGKPVVSTDLPEIVKLNKENDNLILVAENYEEFVTSIVKCINEENKQLAQRRISSAKKNSWLNRIEKMSKLIVTALNRKKAIPRDWKNILLALYSRTRSKFLKLSLISLSAYFLIFYTPSVWFLAAPLKISQLPGKADCIVVFAGGVGESGKVGEGYEERVKYAVDLYKAGYANYLIFSSGYASVFKEPLLMESLAIALGVPKEAIILEDKANSTYNNVKFTNEILDNKKWNEILLISSPYHMRRVALVFNKVAKGVKVHYTPIPKSIFYSHDSRDIHGKKVWKRITLQQIRALLHEYMGIVYYWWKGYI